MYRFGELDFVTYESIPDDNNQLRKPQMNNLSTTATSNYANAYPEQMWIGH